MRIQLGNFVIMLYDIVWIKMVYSIIYKQYEFLKKSISLTGDGGQPTVGAFLSLTGIELLISSSWSHTMNS